MLQQKTTMSQTTLMWVLAGVLGIAGVIALIVSLSNPANSEEEVNAIYTNAALTLEAQQLTLLASQPSATPTSNFTPTPLVTPTRFVTLTPFAVQTFATSTSALQSGALGCDNSVYISDVTIPDNTVVTPGQAFTKTWKVQNNGTCAWTAAYKISHVSGEAMAGNTTPVGNVVSPGQSLDISVAMVAPVTPGDATGYWKLVNDKNQPFGTFLSVVIKVGGAANTSAATDAPTDTPVPITDTPAP